jgi:hypothetical protein
MQLRHTIIIGLVLGHALGLTLSPGHARAQADGMAITQLQAGGAGSGHAGDEFIELYNASTMPLSLDHWALQYRSGSASGDCTQSWSTKLTLPIGTIVMPQAYWLAAATGYLATADGRFSAGLANTKGTVRLINASTQQVDSLAWGGASCGMGTSAVAPPDGQSLLRTASGYSGSNLTDFALQTNPQSRSSLTVTSPATTYPILELSEVLIDQTSFIELHNPNAATVQVSAYGLMLGSSVYHLAPATVDPDGYLAITSTTSGLLPSMSGGQVSLADPSGAIIDRSDAWTSATLGQSWALSDGGWEWASAPTPGATNLFAVVDPPVEVDPVVTIPPVISIELSELLPNPSSSLNGATEKYVELHNTGSETVVLDGYSLRSGANLGNRSVISGETILPGAYLALPLSVTHLSLAVGGSKVGLFDPAGNLVGETVSYGKAPLGQAYARFSDGWHWTTMATPGAVNILVVPVPVVATAKTKTITPKAAKVAKLKVATTKKTKTAKAKLVKASPAGFAAAVTAPSGRWLLFVLLGLTIVYISYEFRLDLQHYYFRCRRYLASRHSSRRDPAEPDDPGADR